MPDEIRHRAGDHQVMPNLYVGRAVSNALASLTGPSVFCWLVTRAQVYAATFSPRVRKSAMERSMCRLFGKGSF
jgi:hypothetical protein